MSTSTGKIIQVIGPVVDVEFSSKDESASDGSGVILPNIYDALELKVGETKLVV